MMNKVPLQDASIAQRKAQLIAEGAAYRSGIGNATQTVKNSLGAESLAKKALAYLAMGGLGLLKGRTGLAGFGLQTALPLIISSVSALSKKSTVKPVIRGALIAGAVAAMVAIIAKRKKAAGTKDTESEGANDQ